jgi:hypothetical protein
MSTELRQLHLLGATGLARTVIEAGKEWLVLPVVALMEGVIHAVNAMTPEFVPLATLQKAAASWNGKPVTLGHPKRDGKQCSAEAPEVREAHGIGEIRNSRVEGTKLLQEAWIEKARAKKLHPEMFARLEANKTEEVSVGAFVATDGVASSYNGRDYKATWTEASGDHLAFLPGGRGACSVAMGCGTHRAAMRVCEDALEPVPPPFVGEFFRALMPRGWGDDEVKQDLRDALHTIDPAARNGEILRVTNNEIVYCIYPPSMQPASVYDAYAQPSKMTYWKRGYTFEPTTRTFILSLDRTQVEPTTVYETLRGLMGKPAYKDCPMCEGNGSVKGNPCPACDGSGEVPMKAAAALIPAPAKPDVKPLTNYAQDPTRFYIERVKKEAAQREARS